jgi:glucosamine--fructose-6-phosphate aminotransferase (isomerizing)
VTELERAIRAQPGELRRLAGLELPSHAKGLAAGERLWLVGTGTSLHAAELGAAMMARAGIDARFASSLEFARRAPLRAGDGVIVISHTGETAYARSARARALGLGAETLSLTAAGVGWPEAVEVMERERSETYTRSYTGALAVLALIAGELGAEGLGPEAVAAAAEAAEAALAAPRLDDVPEPERLLVLAAVGPAAVTAREGALKLREAARLPAEGYDAEYLLHGSAVPLGERDGLLLLGKDEDGLLEQLGRAAAAEGVAVGRLDEPEGDALMAQIPLTARLQLLALNRAEQVGHDPDTVITGPWAAESLWSAGAPHTAPGRKRSARPSARGSH